MGAACGNDVTSRAFSDGGTGPSLVRRMRARRQGAVVAGALVFLGCFLGFVLGDLPCEGELLLELKRPAGATGEGVQFRGTAPGGDLSAELWGVRMVGHGDYLLGYPLFADRIYGLASADGRRIKLRCRGETPELAVAACSQVHAEAVARGAHIRVLPRGAAPAAPVSPIHWPGLGISLLIGCLGGVLTAWVSAIFWPLTRSLSASKTPRAVRSRPDRAARGAGLSSGPPPVVVFTAPPVGKDRHMATAAPAQPAPVASQGTPTPVPTVTSSAPEAAIAATAVALETAEAGKAPSNPSKGRSQPRVSMPSYESMPAPPLPEGPLVEATPAPGGYAPHPRVMSAGGDEAFQGLCKRIAWNAEAEPFVLGVIGFGDLGARPAMLAARIAWAVARPGKLRVLLIETDFEEPRLHRALSLDALPLQGFSQQLQARLGPASAVPWKVQRCLPMLDVLVESRFRAHRATSAPQFERAIEVFRLHYDVVIGVLPRDGTKQRGAAFAHLADGIVALATAGVTFPEVRRSVGRAFGDTQVLAVVEDREDGENAVSLAPRIER
jgi:Mrp family chromosome partitioning ATPase